MLRETTFNYNDRTGHATTWLVANATDHIAPTLSLRSLETICKLPWACRPKAADKLQEVMGEVHDKSGWVVSRGSNGKWTISYIQQTSHTTLLFLVWSCGPHCLTPFCALLKTMQCYRAYKILPQHLNDSSGCEDCCANTNVFTNFTYIQHWLTGHAVCFTWYWDTDHPITNRMNGK